MKRINLVVIIIFIVMLISSCASVSEATNELTIMTHDSFAVSEQIVREFESQNNIKLVFVKAGDAGSALNRAILTKKSPQADVFFGVDNTFLSRALQERVFEPYASNALAEIPAQFKLDDTLQVTPVDYGDVCINYDREYFSRNELVVPGSLDDLLKPEYGKKNGNEGMLVVENPATSSPGLAFLLTTIAKYGDPGYLDYWQSLKDNGVVVVGDWGTAYYTNFSASSGKGAQTMVVSYASSPAAEVYFASTPLTDAPTVAVISPDTCFRQIEFVGILKGTKNLAMAQKFVDYMLSRTFQEDIPLQMFMYPVLSTANLPQEFVQFSPVPEIPVTLTPDLIALNREKWIKAWSEVMLR